MTAILKTTVIQEPSSATNNLTLSTSGGVTVGQNLTVTGTTTFTGGSSNVRLNGSSSGTTIVQAAATASGTVTIPAGTGTAAVQGVSTNIVSGTAVASTSGTSIDFTSIPSWVKRVTVMFNGVSTSGSSQWLIQIGAGSVDTTGYAAASFIISTAGSTGGNYTTGFGIFVDNGSYSMSGWYTICLLDSNTWVGNGGVASGVNLTGLCSAGSGKKALSGTLDRVRITTVGGTDTFDAGTINIMYE